jgi:PAS domain S-box-containing protein
MIEPIRSDNQKPGSLTPLFELFVSQLRERAVFLIDTNLRIASWSQGVEHLLGYRENEWVGQPAAVIFTPEDLQKGALDLEVGLATERGRSADVRWHLKKSGERIFVDGVLIALRDEAGTLLGYGKLMRDATERHLHEQEREQFVVALRRSNEELSQFAHVVSHDLQAPLRMVKSFTQLMTRKYRHQLDETGAEYLATISDGADRMEQLIRSVLQYAEVVQPSAPHEQVSVQSVIDTVRATLQPQIEESGAELICANDLPSVMADGVQLNQLFQNVIGNAIKYRRPDAAPRIEISSAQHGAYWIFSVADNGVGIDGGNLDRVFEPATRLHGREIPGTGLGLAVCRKIVERHGGQIWAESEPGKGSTFKFTLPQ